MTRLIDADALKADIEQFNRPLCDDYHIKDYVLNQIISDIENQPTVDAVPVQYILTTIREWNRDGYAESAEALEILVMNWGKEKTEWAERKEE